MFIVAIYSLLSAVAIALDLIHTKWVAAFCVAILSASAHWGGSELKTAIATNRPGRILCAILLLGISLWLSTYRVNFFYVALPGVYWAVIGMAVGFFTTEALKKSAAR